MKWGLYFNQFQPDKKDYATEEEHNKAWERWHDFKKNNDREFWRRILDGIDALKEKASSSASTANSKVDYEQFRPVFRGSSDLDTILKSLQSASAKELDEVRADAFSKSLEWQRELRKIEPSPSDYATPEDYYKAYNKWDAFTKKNTKEFWDRLLENIYRLLDNANALERNKAGKTSKTATQNNTVLKPENQTPIVKEQQSRSSSSRKTNASYKPIDFRFDGSNNVDELTKRWSKLSADEILAISNEIQKKESEWNSLISENKPKRDDYNHDDDYYQVWDSWSDNKTQGERFWRGLLRAIREIEQPLVLQKRIQEFKNPFKEIMTPGEYLENTDIAKRIKQIKSYYDTDYKKYGPKKANEMRAELFRDLLLPAKPSAKEIETVLKIMPRSFVPDHNTNFSADELKKNEETFVAHAKEGLSSVARLLKNLGIAPKSLSQLSIDRYVQDRGNCAGYLIHLSYGGGRDTFETSAHECGHGTEHVLEKYMKKTIDLYEKHSVKDKNGNYVRQKLPCNETARVLDFETPEAYVRKEYNNDIYTGKVQTTELSSMYFEYIITQPELFFDPKYQTYFTEMTKIWKGAK